MTVRARKPPPLIDNCRVTHYAVRDRSVPFAGPTGHFVGDKELGAVPCLAIAEARSGEIVLQYCNRRWVSKGVSVWETLERAKARAERNYPGLMKKWKPTRYSNRRAEQYRRYIWKGHDCTFCGRFPDDFQGLIESKRRKARICNICARELAELLNPKPQADRQ